MAKVLKPKKNAGGIEGSGKWARPPSAWDTVEECDEPQPKDKSSRFPKLWTKKKDTRNMVEQFASEDALQVVRHAFQREKMDILPMSANANSRHRKQEDIRKSASTNTFVIKTDGPMVADDSKICLSYADTDDTKSKVIVTVLSSDSSDSSYRETKNPIVGKVKHKLTKTANKTNGNKGQSKEKSGMKMMVEEREVIYLKRDDATSSDTIQNIPWTPVSYNAELQEDNVVDDALSAAQFINVLCHETYRDKTVFIDLRTYDEYCNQAVLGTTHFSQFQNKDGRLSMEKIAKKYKAIVLLTPKDKKGHSNNAPGVQIYLLHNVVQKFKEKFPFFLMSDGGTQDQSGPPITCFENGCVLLCRDYARSIKWLVRMDADVVISNGGEQVYGELSQGQRQRTPAVIQVKMTDVVNIAEYSEKKIVTSELMQVMYKLSGRLDDAVRCVILLTEDNDLTITILALTLMLKNHWPLHDTLTCIEYVTCQECNLKQNHLTVLKNFEKLFFGKRLYSANIKDKINQRFAITL